jgi:octaprenyl-diphosphate synthase
VAFQIADDVLDLGGNAAVAGKTLGTDVEQQKLTLPLIRALTELPAGDAIRLRKAFQNGAVAAVADALAAAGSVGSAEAEARRIATAGRRALAALPPSPYRTALDHVAEWAVQRDR